ncbi:sensor histidine kinase [Arachnia propionica]|uniref:Signal transduction histidine kinase subgroup 3 dimerisation and phosphoacceptor domain-containing protein n=1 Tax=Arachnia propionica TaxID=1750 RepID=A0A3P1WX33_9ACTN|nr:histidine kinase [Arachnia propionica]RRD50596.1 hypothetical protein EII35_04180 [Arachnia propionica]
MRKLLFGRWMGMLMASVWLVFLIFPILTLNLQPDVFRRWLGFAAILLFVPAYVSSFIQLGILLEGRSRRAQLVRGLLLLLLTATIAWAGGALGLALGMAPFLMAYTVWGLWPPLRGIASLGVLAAGTAVLGLSGWGLHLLIPLGATALVGLSGAVGVGGTELEIEAAQQREEQLLSEDRERLARDVHDLVGHTLTVAMLKVQLAERLLETDPARAREELLATQEHLGRAQEELRLSINGILQRPVSRELEVARRDLEGAGITVELQGEPDRIPESWDPVLGWVLREATTNVLRHAGAGRVRIHVSPTALRIVDDGVGPGGGEGRGIPGMRSRVTSAGGSFEILSPPHGGCEVRVTW